MMGSKKASVNRADAIIHPMIAGFMPSPRFKTIDMLPTAPPRRLFVTEPKPYTTFWKNDTLSRFDVSVAIDNLLNEMGEKVLAAASLGNCSLLSVYLNVAAEKR